LTASVRLFKASSGEEKKLCNGAPDTGIIHAKTNTAVNKNKAMKAFSHDGRYTGFCSIVHIIPFLSISINSLLPKII
jgi:hypothetical protein